MKTETLLLEMRTEQREHNERILTELADIKAGMAAHALDDSRALGAIDMRLAPVESMRKTFRWAAASGTIALLGVLAQAGCNAVNIALKVPNVPQASSISTPR